MSVATRLIVLCNTDNDDVKIRDFEGRSFNASELPVDTVTIMIPPDAFTGQTAADTSIVFSTFNRSTLYPLVNRTIPQFGVASTVVSATVVGSENNISSDIIIILRLNIKVKDNCMFWE